jgi:hypothetical protein
MKQGLTLMDRAAVPMPVSHRIGASAFGTRADPWCTARPAARVPVTRGLNSFTVLIASAIAFAIPATVLGLVADAPDVKAPEPAAMIGLRGSLP